MVLSSDFSFALAKESVKEAILESNFFGFFLMLMKKKTIGYFSCVPFSFKDNYQVDNFIKWIILFMSRVLAVVTVLLKHPW